MKPICIPCHRFFRPHKTGFFFTEGMPRGGSTDSPTPPGNERPDLWKPYKVWQGDLYKCQGCGAEIVVGFGNRPISEHFIDGFTETAASLGADKYQVNDC